MTADAGTGTAPMVQTLAEYGLAKVVMATLGGNGEMTVTVRILPADAASRIMDDLISASVG